MIEVSIEYRNLYPWWSTFHIYDEAIEYCYHIEERKIEEMKTEVFTVQQPQDFPEHRVIENRHGIYLVTRIGGTFGFLNVVYLLVMLTTSTVILGAAAKAIDMMAMYLMPNRDLYRRHKYEDVELVG